MPQACVLFRIRFTKIQGNPIGPIRVIHDMKQPRATQTNHHTCACWPLRSQPTLRRLSSCSQCRFSEQNAQVWPYSPSMNDSICLGSLDRKTLVDRHQIRPRCFLARGLSGMVVLIKSFSKMVSLMCSNSALTTSGLASVQENDRALSREMSSLRQGLQPIVIVRCRDMSFRRSGLTLSCGNLELALGIPRSLMRLISMADAEGGW